MNNKLISTQLNKKITIVSVILFGVIFTVKLANSKSPIATSGKNYSSATIENLEQSPDSTNGAMHDSTHYKLPEEKLRADMRVLWDEHVDWTRNVVLCIIDDLPGKDAALTRLLKNQDDIGGSIKPYYGKEASEKLTKLLREHITQAGDLLVALKKDDDKEVERINKLWKTNADDIAKFLSDANPNWKLAEMKKMMQEHLTVTIDEAKARKKKDYDADVKAFDKVHEQILEMSDMIADGIIKQFPDKFMEKKMMGMKK